MKVSVIKKPGPGCLGTQDAPCQPPVTGMWEAPDQEPGAGLGPQVGAPWLQPPSCNWEELC